MLPLGWRENQVKGIERRVVTENEVRDERRIRGETKEGKNQNDYLPVDKADLDAVVACVRENDGSVRNILKYGENELADVGSRIFETKRSR